LIVALLGGQEIFHKVLTSRICFKIPSASILNNYGIVLRAEPALTDRIKVYKTHFFIREKPNPLSLLHQAYKDLILNLFDKCSYAVLVYCGFKIFHYHHESIEQ